MTDETIPEAPTPVATPPEPDPGGVDAISSGDGVHSPDTGETPISRDPETDLNPVEGDVPDEVKGAEDTSTAASASDDAQTASDEEHPA